MSFVTCNMSHFFFGISVEASWWRVWLGGDQSYYSQRNWPTEVKMYFLQSLPTAVLQLVGLVKCDQLGVNQESTASDWAPGACPCPWEVKHLKGQWKIITKDMFCFFSERDFIIFFFFIKTLPNCYGFFWRGKKHYNWCQWCHLLAWKLLFVLP